MSSYGLGARDAPERNETILVLQELLIPVGGTGMGTITHHVKQVKICVIIKVKQGKAFLVKALKTEYSFVREEVAGERYYQLSCTRQASVSVKLMTPGKRGRPPPAPRELPMLSFSPSVHQQSQAGLHILHPPSPQWPISKED